MSDPLRMSDIGKFWENLSQSNILSPIKLMLIMCNNTPGGMMESHGEP
jgi:hypothetical protein